MDFWQANASISSSIVCLRENLLLYNATDFTKKGRRGKIFVSSFGDSHTKRQRESIDDPLIAITPDFEWIVDEVYLHACTV